MPSSDVTQLNPHLYGGQRKRRKPTGRAFGAPPPTANELNHACISYLQACGGKAWRNNTGAMVKEYTTKAGQRKKSFIRFGEKGSADVLGLLRGKFFAIETKTPRDQLSDDQAAWLEDVERCGGVAVIAQALDDVIGAVRHHFPDMPA